MTALRERDSNNSTSPSFMGKRRRAIQASISEMNQPISKKGKRDKLRAHREIRTDIPKSREHATRLLRNEDNALDEAIKAWSDHVESNQTLLELKANNLIGFESVEEIFFFRYCQFNNIEISGGALERRIQAQTKLPEDLDVFVMPILKIFEAITP